MQHNSLEEALSPLAGILKQEGARPEKNSAQAVSIDSLLQQNIRGLLSKEVLTGLEITLLGTLLAHYKSSQEIL